MFDSLKATLNENPDLDEAIRQHIEEISTELEPFVEKIKDRISKEKVYEELKESCENESLFEIMTSMIEERILPYSEMQFLREMSLDRFQKITRYILENAIIHLEEETEIRRNCGLAPQQIRYSIKLLNTVMKMIIYERYSFRLFSKKMYGMFRFDEDRTKFLWEMFTSRTLELQNVALMKNITLCREMREDLQWLINIVQKLS